MFAKYLAAIFILTALAWATIDLSLLPWMREHRLRVDENNRFLGLRAIIDRGSTVVYKATLAPTLIWPSPMESVRKLKRRRAFERWKAFLQLVLQQRMSAAQHDAIQLAEMGDGLVDLAQFDAALDCYEKSLKICRADKTTNTAIEGRVLDSYAQTLFALHQYAKCQNVLAENRGDDRTKVIIRLHQIQAFAESNEGGKADELCKEIAGDNLWQSDPQAKWYVTLLSGQCASLTGKNQQAVDDLQNAVRQAARIFGDKSAEEMRSYEYLAEALQREGKLYEAKDAMGQVWQIYNICEVPDRPVDLALFTYRDSQRYMSLDRMKMALWLMEWSKEIAEKESGPQYIGLARRLYLLSEYYKKEGDDLQSQQCLTQAKEIAKANPGKPLFPKMSE